MSALTLRPRSTVEIVDAGFEILRRHYPSLVTATVALVLPVIALRLLLPEDWQTVPGFLSLLLQSASSAAVVLLVSDAYLGNATDVGAALRKVSMQLPSILGASLMQGIIIGFGLLLLVVPGVIFAAWAFAMQAVVVLEGRTAGESFERSRELARGNVGRILGTLLLAWVVFFVVLISLAAALSGVAGALGAGGAEQAITDLLSAVLYPMVAVVTTLLYYDLRIRKEGFDLEVMASEIGVAPPRSSPHSSNAA